MVSLNDKNRNNTIIENVEYLDMDDPKNSWYFDAERFDVNFPLVRSYKGIKPGISVEDLFSEWYEYWDTVFAYYAAMPDTFGVCISMDSTGQFSGEGEKPEAVVVNNTQFGVGIRSNVHFIENKLFLHSRQYLIKGKRISYALVISRDNSSIENLRKKLYVEYGYTYSYLRYPLYPHTQLIISRDWDLLKRYFFFMIRNHQYKDSKFVYNVEGGDNYDIAKFLNVYDSSFASLPSDYRFNWKSKDPEMVEASDVIIPSREFSL